MIVTLEYRLQLARSGAWDLMPILPGEERRVLREEASSGNSWFWITAAEAGCPGNHVIQDLLWGWLACSEKTSLL